MGHAIRLGKLFGIAIEIDLTWFIIFVLAAASFATNWFARYIPAETPGLMWLYGVVGAILLFASIVAHELSHAYAGRVYGVQTTSVTLFVFGGVSRMVDEPPSPRAEFWIGIAGPLCSFALAAVFAALSVWSAVLGLVEAVTMTFWLGTVLNLMLGAFNLLPGLPLDGGHVVRALAWWKSGSPAVGTRVASAAGQIVGYGLIGLGVLTLLGPTLNLGGLWLIFIGWFVARQAAASIRLVQARQALSGVPVARLMTTAVTTVPADLTVEDLVRNYFMAHAYTAYPVVEGDLLKGVVNVAAVRNLPREQWATTRVGDIVPPLTMEQVIAPSADGWEALARMARTECGCVLITDGDRLLGILTHSDILRLIRARLELGV
jgi:Zn-dependent protease/predicted transcriptional regulator